jgi:hypothetical protein
MKKISAFILLLSAVSCSTAYCASSLEFYTYNGFDPVLQAFQKIALIFAAEDFLDFVSVAAFIGLPLVGFIYYFKTLANPERTGLQSIMWPLPVIILITLYLSLFKVCDSSITVYDPILNRTQTVANLPEGVVMLAGYLNGIERTLVELVDTAGTPGRTYDDSAGGIGIDVVSTLRSNSNKIDPYVQSSLDEYVEDCVFFELNRPGTTLTHEELLRGGNNYLTSLSKATNDSLSTIIYSDTNPEGLTASCTQAYNAINTYFTTAGFDTDAVRSACTQKGFDITNAQELAACTSLIDNTLANLVGISIGHEDFVRQSSISQSLYNTVKEASTTTAISAIGNRHVATAGTSMGIMANEWLPIIKAIMTAISIGLIPFLVIFIPTPLGGKAIGTMAGLFVFLTVWGITDAICHDAAISYAAKAFSDISTISNYALEGMLNMPDLHAKTMAMFGQVRSGGIMLASVITFMLVRFGGSAMAHMAGGLVGGVRGAGQEGGQLATPEGRSKFLDSQEKAQASARIHASDDYNIGMAARSGAHTRMERLGGGEALAATTAGGLGTAMILGGQKKEMDIGTTTGTTEANQRMGKSNVEASHQNASVSQTQKTSASGTQLNNGGLSGSEKRAEANEQQKIGTTTGAMAASANAGKSMQQMAHDKSNVSNTVANAKADEELAQGNIVERTKTQTAEQAVKTQQKIDELGGKHGVENLARQVASYDLNSQQGRIVAAQNIQDNLRNDGIEMPMPDVHQLVAQAAALRTAGSASYIAKSDPNAQKSIEASEWSQGVNIGRTGQQQTEADQQSVGSEGYGKIKERSPDTTTVTPGIQDEIRQFNSRHGIENAQVPALGSQISLARNEDGAITTYSTTELGSASSARHDKDNETNIATNTRIGEGPDGKPRVINEQGHYTPSGQSRFNIVTGEIETPREFESVSSSSANTHTDDSVGTNDRGAYAHNRDVYDAHGNRVDHTSQVGSRETYNDQTVLNSGTMATGHASETAGYIGEFIGKGAAQLTGNSENYDKWGNTMGQIFQDTTGIATDMAQTMGRYGKQGNSGGKTPKGQSSPGGIPGNTTQEQINNAREYFKRTGEINQ